MTQDARQLLADSQESDFLTPGRKTLVGYLMVRRGPRKRDYGLFGSLVVDILEDTYGETVNGKVPRYQDTHSVWCGRDDQGMRRPFVRYKASRPINGLSREHHNHRVEVTCTVGEPWKNGVGAYITRAEGRCLDCE